MARTCRDVVTWALKHGRVISSGETPSADEINDGMDALQSFYDFLLINGMFGELEDVYLDEDDTAEEGKRYYVPAGITLTAPTSEYVDACGNTRQPRDLALYESFDGTTRTVKLYDRTEWVDLLDLGLSDTAPLSQRGYTYLAAALAISPAFLATFGDTATLNPDVRRAGQMFMGAISAKQGSTQNDRTAEYY